MSYAAIYRQAVREATRAELAKALGEIERSTHVVVGRHDVSKIWWYGSRSVCDDFVRGIERDVQVVPMTHEHKELCSANKVRAYRGVRP